MNTARTFRVLSPFLPFLAILLAGCGTTGGVKEGRVSFGIPAIFQIEKKVTNLKVTETAARTKTTVADTETNVQIGLFVWASTAKGVEVSTPKK